MHSGKWYVFCRRPLNVGLLHFTLRCSYSCGVRADSLPWVKKTTTQHCSWALSRRLLSLFIDMITQIIIYLFWHIDTTPNTTNLCAVWIKEQILAFYQYSCFAGFKTAAWCCLLCFSKGHGMQRRSAVLHHLSVLHIIYWSVQQVKQQTPLVMFYLSAPLYTRKVNVRFDSHTVLS